MVNLADTASARATWPFGVIFDFDGTLADTATHWTTAYECCLRKRGRVADAPTLLALAGASVPDAARTLEVPPAELAVALTEAFRERPLTEMPGATALVRSLRPSARLAIASNGPQALVQLGLDQVGLGSCFDAIVSAEWDGLFKPAPDVYLRAAAEIGVRPLDCVAVEDSAVGVEAAKRAGLPVICISRDRRNRGAADLYAPRLDDPAVIRCLVRQVNA